MREKAYTAYEEMIHIPLIEYNPKAPSGAARDLPTILKFAGVPDPDSCGIDRSIVPAVKDPSTSVHDYSISSHDDRFFLSASAPGGHIRAIREGDWTYAVYFRLDGAGLDYGLYNLAGDAGQMNNLLHERPSSDVKQEWARIHRLLTNHLITADNLPNNFDWPLEPALTRGDK